jgi:(1->4)-alpha-D-glucan 1-alpha-D-glucosylmutase
VGGDPEAPRGDALAGLQRANALRRTAWPDAQLAATTHDTKRSADVRARLAALCGYDEVWCAAVTRWSASNRVLRRRVKGRPAPEPAAELGLYQALLGLWPTLAPGVLPAPAQRRQLAERIAEWSRKGAREAKRRTSWSNPDAHYERALVHFIDGLLANHNGFLADFAAVARPFLHAGAEQALSRRLIQLTAPGVPDLYQGDEIGLLALVDPDNRRPPDFARARRRLAAHERKLRQPVSARAALLSRLSERPADDRLILWLTHAALALRRGAPRLFARGRHLPLSFQGKGGAGWLAYLRRDEQQLVLVAARLWGGAGRAPDGLRLRLPRALAGARLRCALTGRLLTLPARAVELAALTRELPLALWSGGVA